MATIDPIPKDKPQLRPYITVKGCQKAIAFYRAAFGAELLSSLADSAGKVGHAEMRIGRAEFSLSDEFPEYSSLSPETLGGSSTMLQLYVEDVDEFVTRAVAAGATLRDPVADQFYGDRGGRLMDPFGHKWWIASKVEDVPVEEMKKRAQALYGMS